MAPETWHPWNEFDYDNVTLIFREQLATQVYGKRESRPLAKNLELHNEKSLNDALRRYPTATINLRPR